jgi:hypothetical protein
MPKGEPQIHWHQAVEITEAGNARHRLRVTLFKSRLVDEDAEGNHIAVDKRKGRMVIECSGTTEWHRD